MFKTKTKTSWSKTKTKTFIFVLEAPRDQDHGLEDYINGSHTPRLTWCWVQALQDHETVINIIDAVVAETEKFSEVAGMKREMVWRWRWAVMHSMRKLLQPEMLSCQVRTSMWHEPRRRCWRPNAVSGEKESHIVDRSLFVSGWSTHTPFYWPFSFQVNLG